MTNVTRALVTALVVVASLGLGSCSTNTGDGSESLELSDLTLERIDGNGAVSLGQGDQPRVFNLWATWCAPCRAELPAFDKVAVDNPYAEIIGVNVGDSGTDAAELVAELDLGFLQLLDPDAQIQRRLKITGMPATVFTTSDGAVLTTHSGELSESELRDLLAELYSGISS